VYVRSSCRSSVISCQIAVSCRLSQNDQVSWDGTKARLAVAIFVDQVDRVLLATCKDRGSRYK
jgi:hypothetical protein